MTPEDVATHFTRTDGTYLFARWGRPVAPVVFGVEDRGGPRKPDTLLSLPPTKTRKNSVAGKRKNYGAEFKAKVALEAIRGELTVAELVAKHGVHQTLINTWKRQALEGMSGIFSGKAEAKAAEKDGEIEKLHTKIGQLVVERDFLAKASGR